MKIILHLFAKNTKDGKLSPKNYPWPNELVTLIKKEFPNAELVQVCAGSDTTLNGVIALKDLPFSQIEDLVRSCSTWIAVDSFLVHLANYVKKSGIGLYGLSDPEIFGYPQNENLFTGREHFRPDQWKFWDGVKENKNSFVKPEVILDVLKHKLCGSQS